ncbi:MAG: M15 family metallopeptidase [Ruminococcus sp.]|nr:M15 family metallopeptidase [Ruminococcus sp.]
MASVDAAGNITGKGEGECVIKVVSADNSNIGAEVKVTVKKAEGIQQIDGITYVNGILIANKTYSLPSTYNPQGLTDDTYSAFQQLATDAAYAGLDIYLSSGFRSYETQDQIYNNYVSAYGQETADTFSARPGHSEHQTGMAIDVNSIDDSFAGTPEAVWLEEHCYEYGFIIRYPKGKDNITGYKYEPWHIRYVGKDVAQAVHNAAVACGDPTLTLEEYLGITSSYQ